MSDAPEQSSADKTAAVDPRDRDEVDRDEIEHREVEDDEVDDDEIDDGRDPDDIDDDDTPAIQPARPLIDRDGDRADRRETSATKPLE